MVSAGTFCFAYLLSFIITEPPAVTDLRLLDVTTTTARISWTPLDCRDYSGLYVGYAFKLSELQSGEEDWRIVVENRMNNTEKYLTNLVAFTNYSFAVLFRNSRYSGQESVVNFMTMEDGMY